MGVCVYKMVALKLPFDEPQQTNYKLAEKIRQCKVISDQGENIYRWFDFKLEL